jgi:hypothetical protein
VLNDRSRSVGSGCKMRGKLSPFFIKNIISKRCINSMEAKQTIFQLTICIIRVLFDIKVPFVDLFLFVCLSVLLSSFIHLSHFLSTNTCGYQVKSLCLTAWLHMYKYYSWKNPDFDNIVRN